jgi:uncharacterized protein (TIGR02266 family)
MLAEAHRKLLVSYGTSSSFLDAYFPNGALGGLLVETDANLALGEEVELEIRFEPGPKRPFHARARVAWRRLRGKGNLRAGVGLEFMPTERESRDRLLAFARGGNLPGPERDHERVPAELRVQVRGRNGPPRHERTGDISEGGLFVRTGDPADMGEVLDLLVRPRMMLRGIAVSGRVVWRREGDDPGMGLQFHFETEDQRRRIARLVSRLVEQQTRGEA